MLVVDFAASPIRERPEVIVVLASTMPNTPAFGRLPTNQLIRRRNITPGRLIVLACAPYLTDK